MEYGKIIAITGLPGLYELVSSKGDGAIVRSLDDQATKYVSGRVHNFTHLESIEVYTERENVNLVEVLNAMQQSGEKLPDEKDNKALQGYFQKVFPSLDFDRVYSSDMKKMVKWYDVLQRNKVEIKLSEPEEELVEETVGVEEAKPKAEKKAAEKSEKKTKAVTEEEKKPVAKKHEEEKPKKAKSAKEKEEAPKPTKKAAAKKEEPKKKTAKKK